ncbi:hypothetical protein HF877_17060 [Rhodococcus sp. BL-253-APC-6A1W]|uniref:hypothetical protein n=1 Tax=Rhodococcus sp. BL-253-APC-6A1W TaxID=2725307 RepID=UPI00146D2197|nr:hypothetical protein [Rhodococcus sp. BL-253-APC-6A1W]NMD97086.1 hypothetical protein [Rhodococcus sp. BL-253-APC-6A1W]
MLRERLATGATHVVIDGILITTDRVAEPPSAPRAPRSICGAPASTAESARASSSSKPRMGSPWAYAVPGSTRDLVAVGDRRITGA